MNQFDSIDIDDIYDQIGGGRLLFKEILKLDNFLLDKNLSIKDF